MSEEDDGPISIPRGRSLDFQTLMEIQLCLNPHLDDEGKRKIAAVIDEQIKASQERKAAIEAKLKVKCDHSSSGEHCFCVRERRTSRCCWCDSPDRYYEEDDA